MFSGESRRGKSKESNANGGPILNPLYKRLYFNGGGRVDPDAYSPDRAIDMANSRIAGLINQAIHGKTPELQRAAMGELSRFPTSMVGYFSGEAGEDQFSIDDMPTLAEGQREERNRANEQVYAEARMNAEITSRYNDEAKKQLGTCATMIAVGLCGIAATAAYVINSLGK